MKTQHVELLQKLEAFQLDGPEASFPFSARLARENGWSPAFTQRVILEYKRFAFLAVAAGHPVSPSGAVDEAWHLHLTYSENYWKIFCPQILGQPLHHQPTQGGTQEHAKFQDWYAQTLASYELLFSNPPPHDIWPSPEIRAGERHDFRRVDRAAHWMIPKPRWKFTAAQTRNFALPAIVFLGCGAMFAQGANPFNWRGPEFLTFYVILATTSILAAAWLRRRLRRTEAPLPDPGVELNPYETAYLNGGADLAVNAAAVTLTEQKVLAPSSDHTRLASRHPLPITANQLEQAVYSGTTRAGGEPVQTMRQRVRPVAEIIGSSLKDRGLIVSEEDAPKATWLPFAVACVPPIIGGIKILIGLGRGKPVAFLVILCFLNVVGVLIGFARRPLRTQRGDEVLAQLRDRHASLRVRTERIGSLTPANTALAVGLFGLAALEGTAYAELRKTLTPPTDAGSSGSSCGGSSCGGGGSSGCGGCGGGD